MKKARNAILSFIVTMVLLAAFYVNCFAAYDPATKGDITTYRNFFGSQRDVAVNGVTITAEAYPPVTFFNAGARDSSWYSEANYNGAVFLFANAVITGDSNMVSIFYDYDQRHGDVRSTEYYIYAAAPGTAATDAMSDTNLIAVLDYDKDDQIYEEIATDTWEDFYSEANAGPMTSAITLAAGTYDIYVAVRMVDIEETFEDDNMQDISAKLAEIVFMNDPSAPEPTPTPEATPTPTEDPTPTLTQKPTETTKVTTARTKTTAPVSQAVTGTSTSSHVGGDSTGMSPVVIVVIVVVAVIVIGGIVFAVVKKKKG